MGVVKNINTKSNGQALPLVGQEFRFDNETDIYLCVHKPTIDCVDCELSYQATKCVKMMCTHNRTQFKLSVKSLL